MESLIQFIIGDATTFTPACMVGLIVFCAILECIGSLAYNIMKAGEVISLVYLVLLAFIVMMYFSVCFRIAVLHPFATVLIL